MYGRGARTYSRRDTGTPRPNGPRGLYGGFRLGFGLPRLSQNVDCAPDPGQVRSNLGRLLDLPRIAPHTFSPLGVYGSTGLKMFGRGAMI